MKAVQESYVAPPVERALRRQALAASLRSQDDGYALLQLMLRKHPKIASLESDLTPTVILNGAARSFAQMAHCKLLGGSPGAEQGMPNLTVKLNWIMWIPIWFLIAIGVLITTYQAQPRPKFAPNDPIRPWSDFQLKLVTKSDGTTAVEAFDKSGKPLVVGEATMRIMGSKELLKKDALNRKAKGEVELPAGTADAITDKGILTKEDAKRLKDSTKSKSAGGSKQAPKNPER